MELEDEAVVVVVACLRLKAMQLTYLVGNALKRVPLPLGESANQVFLL